MHTKCTNCIHNCVHVQKLNIITISRRNIYFTQNHPQTTHSPTYPGFMTIAHISTHKMSNKQKTFASHTRKLLPLVWLMKIDDVREKFRVLYTSSSSGKKLSLRDARFDCISVRIVYAARIQSNFVFI